MAFKIENNLLVDGSITLINTPPNNVVVTDGTIFPLSALTINDFTTGATFNTTNGILEFTRVSGSTFNVDLDGRYLTGFTIPSTYLESGDNISELTNDVGYVTGNTTNWNTAYDDSITGITVSGTLTKTITLEQRDGTTLTANFTDNSGGGGSGDVVTGMTFDTGTGVLTLSTLSGDTVTEDLDGRYLESIPVTYLESGDNISELVNDVGYITGFTDTNDNDYITSGTVTGSNLQLTRLSGGTVDIDVSSLLDNVNTDDFTTGATFTNGILEFTRLSGGTYNVDLDGRYLTGFTIPSTYLESGDNISELINDSGYITGFTIPSTYLESGDNISELTNDIGYITGFTIPSTYLESGDNISELVNDIGYITGFTDTNDNDYVTSGTITGSNLQLTRLSGGTVDIDVSSLLDNVNTDDFTTGATFTNGILEFTRLSGGTYNIDLDGRYLTGFTIPSTYLESGDNISELTNDVGYITGFTDTNDNDYLTGATFSASTGDLTLSTLSGNTIIENLDGRYVVISDSPFQKVINGLSFRGARWEDVNNALFGEIGGSALDLSLTDSVDGSENWGATGDFSFSQGFNVSSSGYASMTRGFNNTNTGNYSVVFGSSINNTGDASLVLGTNINNAHGISIVLGTNSIHEVNNVFNSSNIFVNEKLPQGNDSRFRDNIYTTISTGFGNIIGQLSGATSASSPWLNASLIVGVDNEVGAGMGSAYIGVGLIGESPRTTVVGSANIDLTQTSSTNVTGNGDTYNPRFVVGTGTWNYDINSGTRANGFVVMSDGVVSAPQLSVSNIDSPTIPSGASSDFGNRILITKEYLTGYTFSAISGITNTDDFTTGATFNDTTGIIEFTRQSGSTFSVDISAYSGGTGSGTNTDDYVTSGSVSGETLTLTRLSGGTVDINLSGLTGSGTTKYSETFGDGSTTGFTITHNLNTEDVFVTVKEVSNGNIIYPDIYINDSSNINLEFTIPPTTNQYRVTVGVPDEITGIVGVLENGTDNDDYVISGTVTGSNLQLSRLSGGTVDIDVSSLLDNTNTDDFTTGATFNDTTGIIEFTRQSGDTFSVDISAYSGATTINEEDIVSSVAEPSVGSGYTFDLDSARFFVFTLSANTTVTVPTIDTGKAITFTSIIDGNFTLSLSAQTGTTTLTPTSDVYDGTVDNRLVFDCYRLSNGTQVNNVTLENLT